MSSFFSNRNTGLTLVSVILGLNAFHAGASAALLIDGKPIVAIAEERLNRIKYYAKFPAKAVLQCLEMSGVKFRDIDAIAVGRHPTKNLAKKLEYVISSPLKIPNLIRLNASKNPLRDMKALLSTECDVAPEELRFKQFNVEHHLAHTASAYFISPWEKAAGFTLDGSGDFVSCMLSDCTGNQIRVKHRIYVPHSLGHLYTMIGQFIGYGKYGDEGKVMGLAPYGTDAFQAVFDDMVALIPKGVRLNLKYFRPMGSDQGFSIDEEGEMIASRHYSDETVRQFGKERPSESEVTQRDKDLAFGLQRVFEKGYLHLLNELHKMVPVERLAIAGGCALNSAVNGKIFDQTPFKETCIQPAAGDDGLALGAALYVSQAILKDGPRTVLKNAYLGTEFTDEQILSELDKRGVVHSRPDRETLLSRTVDEIAKGNVIGWFQGRMEWGPRALGNRSILTHPGLPNMKDILNTRIKRREWFRPFAPAVLEEKLSEIFEGSHPSPFMLHVYKIKPQWRERLQAVCHVDQTGRVQTVNREENPLYYDLIQAFGKKTGIPVLLNTSFNENEPIVCTPAEAIECFLRTKMDALAIGSYFCKKS